MIIIESHKIYPAEVEKHIRAFADIRECVVTSVSVRGEDILCCLYSADAEIQSDIINRLGTV